MRHSFEEVCVENKLEISEKVRELSSESAFLLNAETLRFHAYGEFLSKVLGHSPKELNDFDLKDVVLPADLDITIEVFNQFLFGDSVANFRNRLLRKDGSIVTMSWRAEYSRADGNWVAVLTDISELIKIEGLLQSERQRFETILETVSEAVLLIDTFGRCVFANAATKSIFGLEPNEILWRSVSECVNIPKEAMKQEFDSAIAISTPDSEQASSLELTHLRPDGKEAHLSIYVKSMRGPEGVVGKVCTVRDVSILKRQQAELIHASKMMSLGEMAGGVAHEINNPLAIINGRAGQLRELLDEPEIDLKQAREMVDSIERTSLRIAKIVKGLRTFSRNAESDPFEVTPLKIIVEDTLAFCRERFRIQGVGLEFDSVDENISLECRATQISQALLNLLNNAFDAALRQQKKWVRLAVECDDSSVSLRVTDSGRGIPDDIREKILQPFFTTKDVGQGTGLGLSISRGIVQSHGGELYLDLQSKNTSFVIKLTRHL